MSDNYFMNTFPLPVGIIFAQSTSPADPLGTVKGSIADFETVIVVFAGILLALIVGFIVYYTLEVVRSESRDTRKKAVMQLVYGVIAIAVLVSIWGAVSFLQKIFGVSGNSEHTFNTSIDLPSI